MPSSHLSSPTPQRRPTVLIVTPYGSKANNGNWRTARRWGDLLAPEFNVIVQSDATRQLPQPDLLIALHARRSAEAIAHFRKTFPALPIVLVLTGTDLYKDWPDNPEARESVATADRLVVLQDDALNRLPAELRKKADVVFQSARLLVPARKAAGKLDCVVVGHLRAEKSPETVWQLFEHLPKSLPIRLTHIGNAPEPAMADAAKQCAKRDPRYRWVGPLPHGLARTAIKRAHLLIHPSLMEGGANVIVEAITAGTPVLASRMSGNLGMLGRDYEGYFAVGNARELAAQLVRALQEPGFLATLSQQCESRKTLFTPEAEQADLIRLIDSLLQRNNHAA